MSPQLHETGMGRKLIEITIPNITKSLETIAQELKRLNDNLEKVGTKNE